jgi:adenosylhomocysteine nucleosidase
MKTGIIGAMDVEIAHILSQMESKKETKKAGMTFVEGVIGKTEAVVVKSGVGKVNAALCAQMLIDCFGITHLINSGIAGSLNNEINIGDLVVSTDAVEHDMDATVFGYAKGEAPGMGVKSYEADAQLRKTIVDTIRITAPEISVFEGRIATGDQFISSKETKDAIRDTFRAMCCEMEGAAIAHAAYLNQIPFVIMRYISDKADEEAEVSYPEFEAAAAKHSAELIVSVIRNM